MGFQGCCHVGRGGTFRSMVDFGGWLAPGAILLFIPKCPLCIAAYVAMFTGIGLSVSNASSLRIGLIVISLVLLIYLAVRWLRKLCS